MIWQALSLQLGYNATLVAVGATLLGIAAGVTGSFLFLRKRALVSDAVSHATLPGIGLAFIVMVALGGDGRFLPGLMVGAAVSSGIGLLVIGWMIRRTRLTEDAAIGAVLSVFFGAGIVVLTVIQSMQSGRQAGLETVLLGSTAGMLRADALVIAGGGALVLALVVILRRPMLTVGFDPDYAAVSGINVARIDLAMMGLVMAVTVLGITTVGLVLIVALLIIPAVTARLWTDHAVRMVALAGLAGGLAAYLGAAISATAPSLPTGPIIVLCSFTLFAVSLALAPARGGLAVLKRQMRFRRRVHRRQGLLALALGQPIHESFTLALLQREGHARADGVPTEKGRAAAAKALLDEARWAALRADPAHGLAAVRYDGLTAIEAVLTPDQIAELDRHLPRPKGVL
ncbi:MAG: metal ABC transporter permease [Rhodobacterales bacterium]